MDLSTYTRQLIDWYSSGSAEDLHRVMAALDPRCTIFGPGGENQYGEVSRFAHDLPDLRARNKAQGLLFRYTDVWCREKRFDDFSRITYGGLTILCRRRSGEETAMQGRFTFGFQLIGQAWRVMHIHFSVANPELQGSEHFPAALTSAVQATCQQADRLQELARRDFLTGMLNLRALTDYFRGHRDQPLWLVELDLDDFKSINDTYGHEAGNRVLTLTARILTESVRCGDAVGRTGGDEFVLLLSTGDRDDVEGILDRILHRVEATANDESCWTHLSMGAVPVRRGESLRGALDRADKALYQVKRRGKCSYKLEDEALQYPPFGK